MGRNRLRFIRNVLYRLKRDYGLPADIYHQTAETVDLTTGIKSTSKTKVHINRAILLPAKIKSNFVYDLSYIAANKNFTYGGQFNVGLRNLVIEYRDLYGFDLTDFTNCYIITGGKRYEISEIAELDYKAGYQLKIKAVEGVQLAQIVEPKVVDKITVDGSVT